MTGSPKPEDTPVPEGMEKLSLKPKLYIDGFPKSGLHLAMLFAITLVDGAAHETPWAGTFDGHGWTNHWMPDWRIYQHLARLREGTFLKGHAGYRDDIAEFLNHMGAQMAFIYRDLRDVVVSQSFHVLSEDDKKNSHADKDLYRALDSQEEVILACINGLEKYPGVIERWEMYAPWLDVEWVHKMRYEDMRLEPFSTAREFVLYVYNRIAAVNGINLEIEDNAIAVQSLYMVMAAEERHRSPTYRKGIPGGWREWWTDRIDKAFEDAGGHEWNRRIGYE